MARHQGPCRPCGLSLEPRFMSVADVGAIATATGVLLVGAQLYFGRRQQRTASERYAARRAASVTRFGSERHQHVAPMCANRLPRRGQSDRCRKLVQQRAHPRKANTGAPPTAAMSP